MTPEEIFEIIQKTCDRRKFTMLEKAAIVVALEKADTEGFERGRKDCIEGATDAEANENKLKEVAYQRAIEEAAKVAENRCQCPHQFLILKQARCMKTEEN